LLIDSLTLDLGSFSTLLTFSSSLAFWMSPAFSTLLPVEGSELESRFNGGAWSNNSFGFAATSSIGAKT
jgi:hypothetical protein